MNPTNTVSTVNTASTANTVNTVSTYRFKYTPQFQRMLHDFASKHADLPKKEFDACFKDWCDNNRRYVTREYNHLVNQGYNRDFQQKMYLSVRYYFRNKSGKSKGNGEGKGEGEGEGKEMGKKKSKLKYVRLADELKILMKQHIYDNRGINKSPKEMFGLFYNSDNDEIQKFLKSETAKLQENEYSEKDILFRIKKMYKNLYFVALRNNNKLKQ